MRGYVLQSCVLQELEPALLAMSCGRNYISSRADRAIANSWYRADLTGRERDVLQLLGKGHCNKLIAREPGLAEETVKTHLKNVMSKLNVSARVQAVVVANERGLLAN
ncbi:response regulator transcription factor [Pseudoduganella sp. RAF53_2]|uniref:response regulator transcription factor n=1 Tax=unclassified Pseudoduganella TaxID=2637179 RepID=UPI003F9B56F5